MKKLFALLLALVMSFALFSCTPEEDGGDDTTPPEFEGNFDTPITDMPLN